MPRVVMTRGVFCKQKATFANILLKKWAKSLAV